MSNTYTKPSNLIAGTTARAEDINNRAGAAETGFDNVEAITNRTIKLPVGTAGDQLISESGPNRASKEIGFDASGNLVLIGSAFQWKGDWATSTAYIKNDIVRDSSTKNLYAVVVDHTSGVLATDVTAVKMSMAINVVDVETAKTAAQTAQALSEDWAEKTTGAVTGTSYSSKHWATTGTVQTVSTNIADINTTADNIASVNTVATNIVKVVKVADDLLEAISEIETVAADLQEVSSEIEVVGASIANVDTTAVNIANVNTVATNITNVNKVGVIDTNVTTVANNDANVTIVAGNTSNITTVAGNNANVTTVAGISADVTSAAGISANITTVAGNTSNINIAAGISANITTAAGIASDISTNATNIAAIQGADANATTATTQAGIATTKASEASTSASNAATSETNAATSETNAATSYDNFDDRMLGSKSSAPSVDNDGDALLTGAMYWDTVASAMKAYDGSAWVAVAPSAGDQAFINIVGGELVYSEDLGSIATAVTTGSGNSISIVGAAIANVNSVGGSIANVNAVAGNSTNINAVNTNSTNINIVAAGIDNLDAAAANSANISSVVANETNINLAAGSITNVNTVASSIADVNRYANEYKIAATAPAGPSAGDLWLDTTASILKYYTGSTWSGIVSGITSVVSDTTPQLGGALDGQNNNMTNIGTVSGSNLQIDFGGL